MKAARWIGVASLACALLAPWPARGQPLEVPTPEVTVIDDDTVTISWPDLAPGFILQESAAPGALGPWWGVLQTPVPDTGRLKVTRSLSDLPTRWFFRLRTKGINPGLDYLQATQNPNGTWGNPARTPIRDTAAAVEALRLDADRAASVFSGLSGLFGRPTRNNDDTSRKADALAAQGYDIGALLNTLLEAQSAPIDEAAALSFPGRGWGLARGFGSSPLDTALVLRALHAGGLNGGLAVAKEPVGPSAASALHSFTIPSGASDVLLKVRAITGGTLRFYLTPPGSGSLYVDLGPASVPINIVGLPTTPGQWTLQVQNLSTLNSSYTAEIGFTDATGFDQFRVTTPLLYLGLAQNPDGGWGIAKGEDSHLMITAEVLCTLGGWGPGFVGPTALGSGVGFLGSLQNADGGFSSEGSSNPVESGLAILAIRAANPAASVAAAAAYLKAAQLPNGSWGDDPYQTALVVRALHMGPVISAIPDQSVVAPTPFAPIDLDNYVTDPDHADHELSWTVTGNAVFGVSVVDRVATITYPPATSATEELTFTVMDPDGYTASTAAWFSVVYQPADYTLAPGGSVNDARIFTGDSAVLDQIAFFTEQQRNVPAGVTYTTTGVARISATEIQVSFQIAVGPGVAPGIYEFEVEYGLLDAASNPLGPLSGNLFNLSINVTP